MSDSRILVVDSDESHAVRCTQFLEQQGFEVSVAADVETACKELAAQSPVAVLLDALVEGGPSSTVAARAREQGAALFGMSDLLLGPTNREIAIRRDGCADYWDKPLEADRVLGWLRRVLGDRFPSPKPVPGFSPVLAPPTALDEESDDTGAPDEPWGDRPTSITPVDAEAAVAAVRAASAGAGLRPPTPPRMPPAPPAHPPAQTAPAPVVTPDMPTRVPVAGAEPAPADVPPEEPGADVVAEAAAVAESAPAEPAAAEAPAEAEAPADEPEAAPGPVSRRAETVSGGALAAAMRSVPLSTDVGAGPAPARTAQSGAPRTVLGRPAIGSPEDASRRPASLSLPLELDAELVSRRGDLGKHSFAAILANLCAENFTGSLAVRREGVEKTLYFSAGEPVASRSSASRDSLPAFLLADGLLREDQRDAISRNLGARALEETDTYIDAGLFQADDLTVIFDALLRRRMLEIFSWTSGSFESAQGAIPDHHASAPSFGALELIWQGMRFGVSAAQRSVWLGRFMAVPVDWVGRPPRRDEMDLTRWQRAIVGSIDGVTSTEDVIVGAPDRDEALALICALASGGFVAFRA